MGWIDCNDRLPPEGLQVLIEASGEFCTSYGLVADHDFYLASYLVPEGQTEGEWIVYDSPTGEGAEHHMYSPTVHAWMPLPKHFAPNERFYQEPDLMEHAMFDDDPPDLYKGDMVYKQMNLEEFLGGAG